jgi:hypothetical protein
MLKRTIMLLWHERVGNMDWNGPRQGGDKPIQPFSRLGVARFTQSSDERHSFLGCP